MNPLLISSLIGGAGGAIDAYRKSGGDLGQTFAGGLVGGGLGAILPGAAKAIGTRFAGSALGAKVAPEAYKAGQVFARTGTSTVNPIAQQMLGREALAKALGGTALVAGGLAIPGLAAAGAQPISKAAQAATQVFGAGKQMMGAGKPQVEGPAQLGAIPDILSDPGLQGYLATMDPMGRAQATLALQQQYYDQNLANASRASNVTMRFQEAIKDRDFQRSAKAAELSTALTTNAAMRQQAQLGAQALGQGVLQGVAQAGATQYRYL